MKTLKVRQRSFQKLTQFTMLNKVQDPLACKVNLLLQEQKCFSHSLERGDSAESLCADPGKHWEVGSTPLKSKLNSPY
jgi:hypothetical protein